MIAVKNKKEQTVFNSIDAILSTIVSGLYNAQSPTIVRREKKLMREPNV